LKKSRKLSSASDGGDGYCGLRRLMRMLICAHADRCSDDERPIEALVEKEIVKYVC
jgi:hypothetical protein